MISESHQNFGLVFPTESLAFPFPPVAFLDAFFFLFFLIGTCTAEALFVLKVRGAFFFFPLKCP